MSNKKINSSTKKDNSGSYSFELDGRCPNCGKPFVYVGDVPEQGWAPGTEPFCVCWQTQKLPTYQPLPMIPPYPGIVFGWICPKCGRSNSPSTQTCPCSVNFYPHLTCHCEGGNHVK